MGSGNGRVLATIGYQCVWESGSPTSLQRRKLPHEMGSPAANQLRPTLRVVRV